MPPPTATVVRMIGAPLASFVAVNGLDHRSVQSVENVLETLAGYDVHPLDSVGEQAVDNDMCSSFGPGC